ncbi:hypothetical protein KAR91_15390 [Candidatus Pacearchaeota archaeon]|nr:hypothetical protein [Candidatus Pacearchaeota archaeon]
MSFGVTGIGDFSNNKYAAAMKELANGLAGWSGLLLLPFLIYQIVANDSASFFSLKSLLVILAGEIVFVIAAHFGNIILATITLPLVMPFGMKGKIAIAQNIQTTILVVFGLSLCVFAWFFASYSVSYAYPASAFPAEFVQDRENLSKCFAAFNEAAELSQVENGSSEKFSEDKINEIGNLLNSGLKHGKLVRKEFLDWLDPRMIMHFQNEYLKGQELYVDGFRHENVNKQIEGNELIQKWHNEYWKNVSASITDKVFP